MKPVPTTLLASLFIAAPFITASAGGRECLAQFGSKSAAALQVDKDIETAVDAARHGRDVRPDAVKLGGSVKDEDVAWATFPDQCQIQAMMLQEIGDLQKRANIFRAHEAEFRQFQFQVVLGRFERAVLEIQEAWKAGLIADDIAEKTVYEMRVEAMDYLGSLGVTDIRERLEEAIFTLVERGHHAIDRAIAQQEFFVKLYTIRLEAAIAVWMARGADGTATVVDLDRLGFALAALERLQKFDTPHDCGS